MDAPQQFQEAGFLRWRRSFPWLHLLRVPGIAARIPILLVGFVASFLILVINSCLPSISGAINLNTFGVLYVHSRDQAFANVISPNLTFYSWLRTITGYSDFTYFGNLTLTLFVQVVSGLIICRMAASLFTIGESTSLRKSVFMGFKKIPAVGLSFLFPSLLISFLAGLGYCCVATEKIPAIGYMVSGIFYGPGMLFFFLVIVFTLGILIGWPFIIASLMIEDGDGFDAWSRSFDYIRSRLIPILFFFTMTMIVGILIQAIVSELTVMTWAWLDHLVLRMTGRGPLEFSWMEEYWKLLWICGVDGFLRSYYWVSVVGVYLLARYSVDSIPTTEFLVDDKKRPTT